MSPLLSECNVYEELKSCHCHIYSSLELAVIANRQILICMEQLSACIKTGLRRAVKLGTSISQRQNAALVASLVGKPMTVEHKSPGKSSNLLKGLET